MQTEEMIISRCNTAWGLMKLGLGRMTELMELLGRPDRGLKVIHVAGTNGKGSACSMLSSVLIKAGYRVGMYTSPHLVNLNERFVINGEEISDHELLKLADEVGAYTEKMEERPTEFEYLTAMGYYYFAEQKCDVVVMEVGLGGRLDATNVLEKPLASLIMNIGLEHTEWLGDTIEKIAGEKAGIIKEGCDVIYYSGNPEADSVFQRVALEKHCGIYASEPENIEVLSADLTGQTFNYQSSLIEAENDGNPIPAMNLQGLHIRLTGPHQIKNAAAVLKTIEVLRRTFTISDEAVFGGLEEASWPARFEVLNREPLFILDGGHNPQCLEALADALKALLKGTRVIFLTGVLADKDYDAMMHMIMPFAAGFVTLTPDSPRALSAEKLALYLKNQGIYNVIPCETTGEGVEEALTMADGRPVVAFGSLYMAGAIRDYMLHRDK